MSIKAKDEGNRYENVNMDNEHIRNNKFWNDYIQKKVGVLTIEKNMTKTRLW